MADATQLDVWEDYAAHCKAINKKPIEIKKDNWFANQLKKLEINSVIDLGCGPGNWQLLFKDCDYTGFDQSPSMLDYAKSHKLHNKFVLGNAQALVNHFKEDSIDMVFSSAVIQHNKNYPDKENIINAISTVLKPNGHYMCAENTFYPDITPESIDDDYTDGYSFTTNGWIKYMAKYGFEIVDYNRSKISYLDVPTSFYLYKITK